MVRCNLLLYNTYFFFADIIMFIWIFYFEIANKLLLIFYVWFCNGFYVYDRLFYDKNSGKSLGFAFCEYKEPEIAISAARNLGGYELKGQPLRVDVATSEKCRQELESK